MDDFYLSFSETSLWISAIPTLCVQTGFLSCNLYTDYLTNIILSHVFSFVFTET